VFWFSVNARGIAQQKRRDTALRAGIFKAWESINPIVSLLGGTVAARLNRLDESARLSLGMVASPQSQLPFHPTSYISAKQPHF